MAETESILVSVRGDLYAADEALKQGDFERAMHKADSAIDTAFQQNHPASLAAAYYAKASVIWNSGGSSEDAHHFASLAAQNSKPNTRTDLMVRTLIARLKAARGNSEAAILLNEDVLRYYYETDDLEGQADILRSLGDIYRAQGRFDLAQERYFAALSVYRDHHEPLNHAGLLLSMGALMYQREDKEQARRYWLEAQSIAEANGFRHVLASIQAALEMLAEG